MELRGVRYFMSVAEILSFSRAAERLHVSQSALSRQVQSLERQLEVKLFDRIGRRIALTPAGEELLAHCHTIAQDFESLRSRAKELAGGSRGILRIGVTPQTLESLVADVLRHYRKEHPDVEILLTEDGSAKLAEMVQQGSVHLAIGALTHEGYLNKQTLFPLGVLAVVPTRHKLSNRRTIDISDLNEEPVLLLRKQFMTRQLFDGACQIAQVRPRVLIESGSPHCLLALVDSGHGIAIIPSTVRLSRVAGRVLPLQQEGRQLGHWVSLIWNPRRYMPPFAKSFMEEVYRYTRRQYPGKAFRFGKLLQEPASDT